MRLRPLILFSLLGFLRVAAQAQLVVPAYSHFVLANGLTVLVREDHREPVVAITIWYHVGSKDEEKGKRGVAHLVEHLMFEGSEHHRGNFVQALEAAGGSGINAVTNQDRTAFYEIVPTSALEYTLWLEADRMAHVPAALDQAALDAQRAVIENEERQSGDVAGAALAKLLIAHLAYPIGHPYFRPMGAKVDDLTAISLADVESWITTYYGPGNAVLVLAGDVNARAVRPLLERYFGNVPPRPPAARGGLPQVESMDFPRRQVMRDRVSKPHLYFVWSIPGMGSAEADYLDLASTCLTEESAAVRSSPAADHGGDMRASISLGEVAGQFQIEVALKDDADAPAVEQMVSARVRALLEAGPILRDLLRAKAIYLANAARALDRLGGVGSFSDRLAEGEVFRSNADAFGESLARVERATASDLRTAARRWLASSPFLLAIFPQKAQASKSDVPSEPSIGPAPKPRLPDLQRTVLPNGLHVMLGERHETPLVSLLMIVNAGFAGEDEALEGTATLTASLLDGGTTTRARREIREGFAELGAEFTTKVDYDATVVRLSVPRWNLPQAIERFADLVAHASFPSDEFLRQREQQLAAVKREEGMPLFSALRVLGAAPSGPGNLRCGNRFNGTGTLENLRRLPQDEIIRFYRHWYRPNNATLVVVGDITLPRLTQMLKTAFAAWESAPQPAAPCRDAAASMRTGGVYLVDKPGAQQSFILTATAGIPRSDPRQRAAEVLVEALAGNKSSRLNLDLREKEHLTYGVQSSLWPRRGREPFVTFMAVAREKTKEALRQIALEYEAMRTDRPLKDRELAEAEAHHELRLATSFLTLDSLGQALAELVMADSADASLSSLSEPPPTLMPSDLQAAAEALLAPAGITWIVVGDRSVIKAGVAEAGLGPVTLVANISAPTR